MEPLTYNLVFGLCFVPAEIRETKRSREAENVSLLYKQMLNQTPEFRVDFDDDGNPY